MSTAKDKAEAVQVDGESVRFTNPTKVLYPETGTTKADVLDYYLRVASVMVPQAMWRPATRKRWVNGVGTEEKPGDVFWIKALERGAPSWVPTVQIEHRDRTNTYPLVNNAAVLAWFSQLSVLEVHVPQWGVNPQGQILNPDKMVFDLDPGPGVDLQQTAGLALVIRDRFAERGLKTYPVTSGSKGIHIYVPLSGEATSEQSNAEAKRFAKELETEMPGLVVSKQSRALRPGKILVDWSQNNRAKSTICPYSLRGKMRPMVAAPRTWEEIASPDLAQLDYREVLARVEAGVNPIAALAWSGKASPARLKTRKGAESSGKTAEDRPQT